MNFQLPSKSFGQFDLSCMFAPGAGGQPARAASDDRVARPRPTRAQKTSFVEGTRMARGNYHAEAGGDGVHGPNETRMSRLELAEEVLDAGIEGEGDLVERGD